MKKSIVPVALIGSLLLWLSLSHFYLSNLPEQGNYKSFVQDVGADIVLVTVSTCFFCNQARDFLLKNQVEFVELILDSDPVALSIFEQYFEKGFLPLLVSENQLVIGFNKQKMAVLLEI